MEHRRNGLFTEIRQDWEGFPREDTTEQGLDDGVGVHWLGEAGDSHTGGGDSMHNS